MDGLKHVSPMDAKFKERQVATLHQLLVWVSLLVELKFVILTF